MPGSRLIAPWATRRATRSPPSSPCPRRWSSRTASRSPLRPGSATRPRGSRSEGWPGWASSIPSPPRCATALRFELPSQIDPGRLEVHVGDSVAAGPDRADVASRADLGRRRGRAARIPGPHGAATKDVRGGAVSLVKGATASFTRHAPAATCRAARSTASRRQPQGPTRDQPGDQDRRRREHGVPLARRLRPGREGAVPAGDQRPRRRSPSLACEDLPRQKVVLDTECSTSRSRPRTISASSGSAWNGKGVENAGACKSPAKGEQSSPPAANDKESLEIGGTFSAKSLGIEPQPVDVRIFAEDYFPGRARVYSPPYTLYVLNAEQHAIWLTEQLSKWHRQSLEVRDREMQLFETNKQLRDLSADELDRPETRRRIENQADGRAGQRPAAVGPGRDAAKTWSSRPCGIPSSASATWRNGPRCSRSSRTSRPTACRRWPTCSSRRRRRPLAAAAPKRNKTPMAGMVRDTRSAPQGRRAEPTPKKAKTGVPQVVDRESSQQPLDKDDGQQPPRASPPARLG